MKIRACLSSLTLLSLFLVACTAPDSGEGEGENEGNCPAGMVDASDVDAFFASIACTYRYVAEDRVNLGDATFTHGEIYDIVIAADKTISFPADNGDLVFDYAAGGTFDDADHETNVFMSAAGKNLILQWDKEAGALSFYLSEGASSSWQFDDSAPAALPGPFDATDEHDNMGFVVGTWGGPVEFISSLSGNGGDLPACTTSFVVIVDEDGSAEASLGGTSWSFPFHRGETVVTQADGVSETNFRVQWMEGEDADLAALEINFARPLASSDAGAFATAQLSIVEGTFDFGDPPETYDDIVRYSTIASDTTTCP